ncbi:carotenoid oxygenase family protein [Microdochium nivale]|nr:carotenoid oxygenase family protein [Microdochium nivale]
MAGHFRNQPPTGPQAFGRFPQLTGIMKPSRFEGEVQNLEVEGSIPDGIDGTFYRVMPDPQMVPFIDNEPWFNGDGNISAFRLQNGRCHFKQRYVRTEKFKRERQAQRALLGKYRNKHTDLVEFQVRSTANTNIFYFNGRLLACKEDSPAYAVDPVTLETIGLEDFGGQMPSLTFTAHPKLDPVTGELHCFGYEAKGDGTPDVCYWTVSPDGKVGNVSWVVAPAVAMIHDFAVTDNWVLFPLNCLTCDPERLKAGGEHWQWTPENPFYLGVMPRHGGNNSNVKWFHGPTTFPGHTANAHEAADGRIVFDLPMAKDNVFVWWPDKDGNAPNPQTGACRTDLSRYTFDPRSDDLELPAAVVLGPDDCEFPRIDDRVSSKEYSTVFYIVMDPALGTDYQAIGHLLGGYAPYNGIGKLDLTTGALVKYSPGRTHIVQEPVFIPRSKDAAEGDGYVMALVNNLSIMASELHIVDTRDFTRAQAIVYLPMNLRIGLHGNWVDSQDLGLSND